MKQLEAPATPFTLRRMRAEDLQGVLAIERVSFPNPWPGSTFLGEIQNRSVSFPYVAVKDVDGREMVIGYVVFWLITDEAQINNIAVHPDFRRQGVGESLMRRTLDLIRDLGGTFVLLEVRLSNRSAQNVYRKLGFFEMGRRRNYYFNPEEDALVMGLSL